MKNLLILLILVPCLAFAFGPKPISSSSAVTVSATVDVDTINGSVVIDTILTTVIIDGDVRVDSIGTVTVTGTVAVNTEDSVTLSNPAPGFRDSIAAVELTAEDTVEVDMSVVFGNLNGILRVGLIAVDDTRDSTIIQYRFRHGTFDLSTRWMPLYVDTTRTDGEASSIASSCGINEYVGNKVYWSVLYDPSDANPMGCTPIAGDVLQIRYIRLGNIDETLSYITLFTWGTN